MTGAGVFGDVAAELDRWRGSGIRPMIWLRDDDATRPTAALDRLVGLTAEVGVPVLLAVIAKPCIPQLAERLADTPLARIAVHGFAHTNQAPRGSKSTELTENVPGREIDAVIAELRLGKRKLDDLFGDRLTAILVPPWNRISPAVAAAVPKAGFTALSVFAWQVTTTRLPHLNTHVDFMDWRGGRVGHAVETIAAMLAARLGEARLRGGAPIGLMTHHLAHDETAWSAFEATLDFLHGRDDVPVVSAGDCLAATRQA